MRHKASSLNISLSEMGLDHAQLGAQYRVHSRLKWPLLRRWRLQRDKKEETADGMMGRLMLARMKTLEEGFAEVVKEFRGMRTAGNSSVENEPSVGKRREVKGDKKKKRPGSSTLSQTKGEINNEGLRMSSSKGKERGVTSRGTSEYKTPYETPQTAGVWLGGSLAAGIRWRHSTFACFGSCVFIYYPIPSHPIPSYPSYPKTQYHTIPSIPINPKRPHAYPTPTSHHIPSHPITSHHIPSLTRSPYSSRPSRD
ncbi:hypothetical protein EYC84_000437 [Monilinia fructicola]|nr:hypothetical protein EYC84_000437 [Monilinia fructicola]